VGGCVSCKLSVFVDAALRCHAQVTNHTHAKLVVSLVVPDWLDPLAAAGANNKQRVFTVRTCQVTSRSKQQLEQGVAFVHLAGHMPRSPAALSGPCRDL
jgi:hypothetical protein